MRTQTDTESLVTFIGHNITHYQVSKFYWTSLDLMRFSVVACGPPVVACDLQTYRVRLTSVVPFKTKVRS